jgi:hypothetical protein
MTFGPQTSSSLDEARRSQGKYRTRNDNLPKEDPESEKARRFEIDFMNQMEDDLIREGRHNYQPEPKAD